MRRYRVFLILAVIAIGALYHFTSLGDLGNADTASVQGLKIHGQKVESAAPPPSTEPDVREDLELKSLGDVLPISSLPDSQGAKQSYTESEGIKKSQAPAIPERPEATASESSIAKSTAKDEDAINPKATPAEKSIPTAETTSKSANKTSKPDTGPADPIIDGGGGRLEIIAETGIPKIHWSQMPEHFPVPTENLIQLPTGKPKAIPKIQYDFEAESMDQQTVRETKRDMVKKTFLFSWVGYKKKAWMQDELSPVSGKFRNPFCAWGATLIDSLDTLYMMGLKDEFEEAVEAVKEIDFTTSPRNDIPLFETVIRYLGGLVAAYDISDGAHRILLDKAVELADILMGAFDTPNRMPMTFYLWKPTFASQPHRAKTRVVMAELGSLSVEFTRLAQITKEVKYYDAIARITNEFEAWQNNTRLPGLWPMKVDASGCKKPDVSPQTAYDHTAMNGATNSKPLAIYDSEVAKSPNIMDGGPTKKSSHEKSDGESANHDHNVENPKEKQSGPLGDQSAQTVQASPIGSSTGVAAKIPDLNSKGAIGKRDVGNENSGGYHPGTTSKPPECEAQGLASPPFTSSEEFGIGGQADSTYEYLPKEYILLGGLEEKYRTIYETSADAIRRNLLYRTMIPDEKRRILHPGVARISDRSEESDLKPEGSHLGCFAGGMYAVGAKIFDRKDDIQIAKELTDGCVWAYEATTTGIMPDGYLAVQCPDPVDCPWNETLYHEKLDPFAHTREQSRLAQQQSLLEADQKAVVTEAEGAVSLIEPDKGSSTPLKADPTPREVKSKKTENQSSQTKTEQALQTLLGEKAEESGSVGADNHKSTSKEGVPEGHAPIPEQSAEHSTPLPEGGATVEQPQPVAPTAENEKNPLGSRVKRQLGDIEETPAAASPVQPSKETVAAVGSEPDSRSAFNKTEIEPVLTKQGNSIPWSRQPNGTAAASSPAPRAAPYVPPALPTHEEYVKARIKDEKLPPGMTKVTGSRYLLR